MCQAQSQVFKYVNLFIPHTNSEMGISIIILILKLWQQKQWHRKEKQISQDSTASKWKGSGLKAR